MSQNIKGRQLDFTQSLLDGTDAKLYKSTKDRYDELVGRLSTFEHGKTPEAVVNALISKLQDKDKVLAPSTAFSYSAAVKYWLRTKASAAYERALDISEYEVAYARIEELDIPGFTQKSKDVVTKKFNDAILLKLVSTDKDRLRPLTLFIKANLMLGLRPTEWADISFFSQYDPSRRRKVGQKVVLGVSVKNAKVSAERGNGEFREIILNNISLEQLAIIREYRQVVYNFIETHPDEILRDGLYYSFYKNLQQQLKLFLSKHGIESGESLYSTRHQCVANAKERGLSAIEVAALFGHKSPATAKAHYGRKSEGKGGLSILPSVMSMEAVKQLTPMSSNILEQSQEWLTPHEAPTSATNLNSNKRT